MTTKTCIECVDLDATTTHPDPDPGGPPRPTRWWHCPRCNAHLERYRYERDICCPCGAQFNAGGQLLRGDWRNNPSWTDEEVSDLDGFEISQLRQEASR